MSNAITVAIEFLLELGERDPVVVPLLRPLIEEHAGNLRPLAIRHDLLGKVMLVCRTLRDFCLLKAIHALRQLDGIDRFGGLNSGSDDQQCDADQRTADRGGAMHERTPFLRVVVVSMIASGYRGKNRLL